jgi:DNA-binding IclR family transcriptional regulator
MSSNPVVAPSASRKSNSAIGRAIAILRVLRRASTPLTLTAIAEKVGIAPSSAHSLLAQLLAEGAVLQDGDKRYALGPSVFYIGSAYARSSRIYRAVWMEVVAAANDLEVTGTLAVPWEHHHLILAAHRAGDSNVSVAFGGLVPLDAGSWGKVFYAWSGADTPSTLNQYTSATITDPAAFAQELDVTRQRGYAVDVGEYADGVGAVCSPVTSSYGYEGLAAFLGPLARIEDLTFEALGTRLSGLTARASLALGNHEGIRSFGHE